MIIIIISWHHYHVYFSSVRAITENNHDKNLPSPALDNIWVMLIVWRLRGNIIRTALCWIVWHKMFTVRSTLIWATSYKFNRLELSHWDPYTVRRCGYLELYYCNMVEWFWCDSSLISRINWFPSVLWHCWFGLPACKHRPRNDLLCVEWDVKPYTLTHSLTTNNHVNHVNEKTAKYIYVPELQNKHRNDRNVLRAHGNNLRLIFGIYSGYSNRFLWRFIG